MIRGDGDRVSAFTGTDEPMEIGSEESVPEPDERRDRRLPAAPTERPDVESWSTLDRGEDLALPREELEAEEVEVVAGGDETDAHGLRLASSTWRSSSTWTASPTPSSSA